MRGLKKYIRTELCTKEYQQTNQIMSDTLTLEASKAPVFLLHSKSDLKR